MISMKVRDSREQNCSLKDDLKDDLLRHLGNAREIPHGPDHLERRSSREREREQRVASRDEIVHLTVESSK